ncbi:MAG: ATP-binding cassette domain-containing protein [Oscillospiraceae bacterium]|nr:ATP-binding cassette domain-containing protein [Oscillospiraceae bacterium]
MEALTIEHLSFAYPGADGCALWDLSLTIAPGEFFVLCGASGSGKTTLLRQLKPALAPHGRKSGRILLGEADLSQLPPDAAAGRIGMVLQSPDDQIVTDKVWHELAFGPESLGMPPDVIHRRIAEMAAFFGIERWFHRDTASLSGGQKQLVNLAAVMVMQPEVLLLDEPTSQLDPIAATRFLETVARIHRELGATIVISEHNLDAVLPMADRAALLERGKLVACSAPEDFGRALHGRAMMAEMPAPMVIADAVAPDAPLPVTIADGRRWLRGRPVRPLADVQAAPCGDRIAALDAVWFRYDANQPDILRGATLCVHRGELLAILGGNGAGKTTVLRLLAGLETPYRGKVTRPVRTAMLPQEVGALFTGKTVLEDLRQVSADTAALADVIALCKLEPLLRRHPFDLSGGERQRAALGKLLLTKPELLLLDEPTKGCDAAFKAALAEILRTLCRAGAAVALVSHDVTFCAEAASACALLFDGGIAAQDAPRAFFSGNCYYTTAAARMARAYVPNAVTPADVIFACGAAPTPPISPPDDPPDFSPDDPPRSLPDDLPDTPPRGRTDAPAGRRRLLLTLAWLLGMAATLWLGGAVLHGRKYYFISLLLALECMAPIAARLESRRAGARQLVLLAVLCAIGVAGRTAFFMLPQVKPVLALVTLTGAALGAESGFLVGAVTMLLSNLLFGQGVWTPYQMAAAGLVGFLSGLLFFRRPPHVARLALYGAIAAVALYGGMMNAASVLLFQGAPTGAMLAASCLAGLPMDLVHGAATFGFVLLAGRPVLDKLTRVKTKYGL